MDIRAKLAEQTYLSAKPATEAEAKPAGPAQVFGALAEDFAATLREGEETARAAMVGGADPHALVEALAQSELAIETAVTLRDKVVEAYQQILRMPV